MTKVAIVYHSGMGHTRRQAEAVFEGAASIEGIEARLISVDEVEANWEFLDAAAAHSYGTPTYMGSLSAGLKTFFEKSAGRWFTQAWKEKLAGGFSNSGSASGDKLNALVDIVLFSAQMGMLWVSLPLLPGNVFDTDSLNRAGSFLGPTAQSPHGLEVELPFPGDLLTSALYGAHVAQLAKRLEASKAL